MLLLDDGRYTLCVKVIRRIIGILKYTVSLIVKIKHLAPYTLKVSCRIFIHLTTMSPPGIHRRRKNIPYSLCPDAAIHSVHNPVVGKFICLLCHRVVALRQLHDVVIAIEIFLQIVFFGGIDPRQCIRTETTIMKYPKR